MSNLPKPPTKLIVPPKETFLESEYRRHFGGGPSKEDQAEASRPIIFPKTAKKLDEEVKQAQAKLREAEEIRDAQAQLILDWENFCTDGEDIQRRINSVESAVLTVKSKIAEFRQILRGSAGGDHCSKWSHLPAEIVIRELSLPLFDEESAALEEKLKSHFEMMRTFGKANNIPQETWPELPAKK